MVSLAACDREARRTGDRIDLDQNVTADRKPQDIIFVDFEKNWRQFVHASPEIARSVVPRPTPAPTEQPFSPVVTAECVFSADAGGRVPQVTVTWNEDSTTPAPPPPAAQAAPEGAPGQRAVGDLSRIRLDLALHHDGFERNYYTTILASEKLQRFKLPSNSPMINDTEAVLLTGPGLFPKLMDFRAESIVDLAARQNFDQLTMVLRDLSPGLSYSVRRDRPVENRWIEEQRFTFLTPVCPQSF
jgi:hypothetical protein